MSSATLLVAGVVALVVAAVYAHVGRQVVRRNGSSPGAVDAMQAFALWWWALALNITFGAVFILGAALGWTDLALQVTYAFFQRLLVVVGLVGLMSYLLYLLTGRSFAGPLVVYYGVFYTLLVYGVVAGSPTAVYVGDWRTDLVYGTPSPRWFTLLNFAMLVGPPVAGALAYFRLFFRLHDPTQRYRVALVSWALIVWWVVAVLAGQHEMFGSQVFQVVNRFLGLGAALVILAAFQPPAWIRDHWGVRGFGEPPAAAAT